MREACVDEVILFGKGGVLIERAEDSPEICVFFRGASGWNGEVNFEWLKTRRALGVHGIHVGDLRCNWYQGIINETVAKLRPMIGEKKLFCIGTSAGGYAALLFAHLLGGKAIAFGPQTHLGLTKERHRITNPVHIDLAPLVKGKKHSIYYDSHDEEDNEHALRMDVTRHDMGYGKHNITRFMKQKEELIPALRKEIYGEHQ